MNERMGGVTSNTTRLVWCSVAGWVDRGRRGGRGVVSHNGFFQSQTAEEPSEDETARERDGVR